MSATHPKGRRQPLPPTKVCADCRQEKPVDAFRARNRSGNDLRPRPYCLVCERARLRDSSRAHADRRRQWEADHHAARSAYHHAWEQAHPDRVRTYNQRSKLKRMARMVSRLTAAFIQETPDLEVFTWSPANNGQFAYYIGTYDQTPSGAHRPRPLLTSPASYASKDAALAAANELIAQVRALPPAFGETDEEAPIAPAGA